MTLRDENPECLDAEHPTKGECSGAVEYRPSLTGTGMAIPRCDKHWSDRLDQEEEWRVIYPDSPNPPDWFDPMNAGEHWDEDY